MKNFLYLGDIVSEIYVSSKLDRHPTPLHQNYYVLHAYLTHLKLSLN